MNATTRRVLLREVLRGTAPVAAATFAVASVAMLLNDTEDWVGRWVPFAQYVRVTLIVLVPLAVAAGAWQAGREHRRRTADQLASAARPPWQPVVLAWAAVMLGMFTGLLLAWGAAAAATIAPVASYHNSSWLLTLAVALAGIAAAAALGVFVGSVLRSRLVAPVAGLLVYIAVGVFIYEDSWRGVMLAPSLGYAGSGTSSLATGLQLRQLLSLGALAATLLVIAAARLREQLARWEGIEGGFDRVLDGTPWYDMGRADVPSGTVVVSLTNLISWNARLADADPYGSTLTDDFAGAVYLLLDVACEGDQTGDEAYDAAMEAAARWARGGEPAGGVVFFEDSESDDDVYEPPVSHALIERPEAEQRDWMGRYLAAARDCDTAALTELAGELR